MSWQVGRQPINKSGARSMTAAKNDEKIDRRGSNWRGEIKGRERSGKCF